MNNIQQWLDRQFVALDNNGEIKMLRIRWWPLVLLSMWVLLNIVSIVAVMLGAGVVWDEPDSFQRALYALYFWILG